MKEIVKETDIILGNKKKFKRFLFMAGFILFPVLATLAWGFYCGEISRIITAIFGK